MSLCAFNSTVTMFSEEHDKFILEAYFRSGVRNEYGWKYSIKSCHEQFLQDYPNFEVTYHTFSQHVARVVNRFRDTGSVIKGKSTGRNSVLTQKVLDDVQQRLEQSPHKSLRHLALQTGLSYGTCRQATRELKRRKDFLNKQRRKNKFSEESGARLCIDVGEVDSREPAEVIYIKVEKPDED